MGPILRVFLTKGVGNTERKLLPSSFRCATPASLNKLVRVQSIFPPMQTAQPASGPQVSSPGQVVFAVMSEERHQRASSTDRGVSRVRFHRNPATTAPLQNIMLRRDRMRAGDTQAGSRRYDARDILGVEFYPNVGYDERNDIWRLSDKS